MKETTALTFLEFVEERRNGRILTQEELQALRIQYNVSYQRRYYYKRKEQEKRFSLRMTHRNYNILKVYADLHGKSINQFIKDISLAYLQQGYVPRDTSEIEKSTLACNRIGSNINQIVQSLNRMLNSHSHQKTISELKQSYHKLLQEVIDMRDLVKHAYTNPPLRLDKALQEHIELFPDKIPALISLLQEALNDTEHVH